MRQLSISSLEVSDNPSRNFMVYPWVLSFFELTGARLKIMPREL